MKSQQPKIPQCRQDERRCEGFPKSQRTRSHCRLRWYSGVSNFPARKATPLLVLHAFWSLDRGPGLWAEDSRKPVTSAQQGLKSARSHPFAASAETLTKLHVGEIGETTLLLPSLRRSPLDSPEIVRIAPRPASSSVPSLLPWSVPVLWVDPEVLAATNNVDDGADLAAALFPSPSQRDHAGPLVDVRVAASVRYLGELVRFAGELAERGRVLPGIVWVDGAGHEDDATIPGALTGNDDVVAEARWRAVLRGPDALAFSDLTAGMPPSFRAAPASEDAGALACALWLPWPL